MSATMAVVLNPAFGFSRHGFARHHSPAVNAMASKVEIFLDLSSALSLNAAEERAMLDMTAHAWFQLRLAPETAFAAGGPKLERRLDYAIPILRRMIASQVC